MMRHFKFLILATSTAAFTFIGADRHALGQYAPDVGSEIRAREAGYPMFSVELKPLPTAVSALPNSGGVGLGAELFVTPNFAYVLQGYYLDGEMPSNLINNLREETNDPVPSTISGYAAGAGARYYFRPADSSWYAGAGLAYAETESTWTYGGEGVDGRTSSVIPSFGAGYRWVLGDTFLIRLGGEVGGNWVQRNVARTTEAEERGRVRVEELQGVPVLANIDLGLGFTF